MGNDKKIKIIASIIGSCLLLFFAFVFIKNNQYNKKLREEGIKTQAQVINKEKLVTTKGKTKQHYITLAVFEDTAHIQSTKEVVETKPQNINDKIDALFGKTKSAPIGNYQSIMITVPSEEYTQLNLYDFVAFVYLKDEIKKGKLASMID